MNSLVLASVVLVQVAQAQGITAGRYAGAGGITLTVTPGRYSFVRQGRELIGGVLRVVTGDTLEFRDDAGAARCDNPGRYRLSTAGDTLRFTAVEDACAGRRNAFATGWVRVRDALVLTHATVLDMTGGPARAGMTLGVAGGRIAGVHRCRSEERRG